MAGWPMLMALAVNSAQAADVHSQELAQAEQQEQAQLQQGIDNYQGKIHRLEPVTVVASRSARPLSQVASSVTVIDAEEIDRRNIQDIQDLIRYEPGISVPNQGSRFGLGGGFRIRGIGGNRVLTEIDGVPVSDGFAIGDFSNAGRDVIDVDLLKRAEILRGPASTLYGSRAIGGVVSFTTKDPEDFDYRPNTNFYSAAKVGFSSDDDSWLGAATGAWKGDDQQVLVHYTHRDSNELGIVLDDVENDPLDSNRDSILVKYVTDQVPGGRLRLTFDYTSLESETDVLSQRTVQDFSGSFGFPFFLINDSVLADDQQERIRGTIDQEMQFDDAWLSRLVWRVFWQQTRSTQFTEQNRRRIANGVSSAALRERIFSFNNETFGAEFITESEFQTGPLKHRLVAGSDLLLTDIEQLRTGVEIDLASGERTRVVGPDAFPVRDFPASEILELGVFFQDEIQLWDGRLTLIPGVRLDVYDLDPDPDAIFLEDNPGINPVSINETRATPRLGLVFNITDRWTFFAQYAQGFRAPPFNDANVGFTNFQFGYTSLPNPDLDPETSDSLEGGFRFRGNNWSFDVTGFYNEYDDFIESLAFAGINDQGLVVFQSRNVDQASIYGVEGSAQFFLDDWVPGLSTFIRGNWTRGDNDTDDVPLNTVDPASIVTGIAYDDPSGRFGAELLFTASHRKSRVNQNEDNPLFVPAGYGVLDLTAYYAFSPRATLNVGLFNVTDKEYFNWADIQGRPANDSQLVRLLRPGRNISARFRLRY